MAAQDDEHKALLDQHTRRKQQHDLTAKEVKSIVRRGQTWHVLIEDCFFSIYTHLFVLLSLPVPMLQAERVRLEYDQMECWKESNCRCCPKCGSVIEKISGCTRMTCGKSVAVAVPIVHTPPRVVRFRKR